MDFCVVDWGIVKDILVAFISAGVPSVVAWLIFQNWRNQKGSEVIASEAKQSVKDLLEARRILEFIFEDLPDTGTIDGDLKNLKVLFLNTMRSISYIEEGVFVDNLRRHFGELSHKTGQLFGLHYSKTLNIECKEHILLKDDLIESIDKVIDILNPYSIYKVKFQFRSKSK